MATIVNKPDGGLKIAHDGKGELSDIIETEPAVDDDDKTPLVSITVKNYMGDEATTYLNGQELDALLENLVQLRKLI